MDVKKLVVGFLILAAAAGSSAVILSTLGSSSSVASAAPQIQIADVAGSTGGTSAQANAFLPQTATQADQDTSNDTASILVAATSPDPDNLTESLASNFLGGVINANPDGPEDDGTGNPVIATPDVNSIAMLVASTTDPKNITIPDWSLEAGQQPIKTTPDNSTGTVLAYNTALGNIFSQSLDSTVDSIANGTDVDTQQMAYVQAKMQSALGDVLALQTPSSMVPLQKSLVTAFVYDKNMFQLLNTAQTDPVKAALILQGEETNFLAAQATLETEAQSMAPGTISLQENFSTGPVGAIGFLNSMLGIQTANAQIPVFDAATFGAIQANHASMVAKQLEAILKNTLLQILKNTLITLVQREVLTWVQGSGVPRFVQQWGTSLVNAYTASALNAINSAMTCVSPGFAPQLKLVLALPYQQTNNLCANSFQAALSGHTFQQFYNNFSNGSWLAYGATTLPIGDYYGSQFFQSQTAAAAAQSAKQAASLKLSSANGLKGDQVCSDHSNPNGTSVTCIMPNGGAYAGTPGCKPGDRPETTQNGGLCANGDEPQVTTPGIFTAFSVNTATDANSKEVSAATDIVGLLNSVLSSLLSSLANAAISAAGQLVNGALDGQTNGGILSIPSSTIQGSGTPPASLALQCTPQSQTVSSTIPVAFAALGGTLDASNNVPSYAWSSAPDGATGTGDTFSATYTLPGTYTVTLTDSTGDAPANCQVTAL